MENLRKSIESDKNCKKVAGFLLSVNSDTFRIDELPGGIYGTIEKVKKEGGLETITTDGEVIAALGYLLHDDELYIYFLAIAPHYRRNSVVFRKVLSLIANLAQKHKKEKVVFKALSNAEYNNNIYSSIAFKSEGSINAAGIKSHKYYARTSDLMKFRKN